jgi:outer membrane protein assembly factor BamB
MVRAVAIAGAVGGVLAAALPGGAIRPDWPDTDVVLAAAGLLGVAGLTFVRRAAPVAAALALAVAGWAVWCLTGDLTSGLPGASTAVLTAVAVVVFVAVGLNAVWPKAMRPAVTTALIVVLVAGAVAGGVLAPGLPVRASQAAAVEPAALAERPGQPRWTWRSPRPVREVVPAGAGVVVALERGELVALDGPTGAERWRHARQGAHLRTLVATPDRATVLAAFDPGGGRDTGAERLVVFDAVTGAVIHESTMDDRVTDRSFLVPTNTVLPHRDGDTVRALDLRNGKELWTWRPPDGCSSPFFLPSGGHDIVITTRRCGDRVGIVALDDRTGRQRWELMSTAADRVDIFVDATPDPRILSVRMPGAGVNLLVRMDDGTALYRPAPNGTVRVRVGPWPALEDTLTGPTGPEIIDPTTGAVRTLPAADCPKSRAHTTTTTAYLRVCADDSLTWQDFATGQVSTAAIGWGPEPPFPSLTLSGDAHTVIRPAPGAIVLARSDDTLVTGYPAARQPGGLSR